MDIRKSKIKGIFVLTVLIILCLCGVSVLSFFTPNKIANAILADDIATSSTNLGEMLLEGYEEDTTGKGKVFNGEIFWELIKQITNEENLNKNILNGLGKEPKTSKDFRTFNGGKDIVVQIGKKKWIATYLSTNSNGEPILTLWLATNSETLTCFSSQSQNENGKYPSNMYGTSEMRAITLNNGGGYVANYNDEELTLATQSPGSEWAIYTMDKTQKSGSIKEFIEVPDNISWQHEQSAIETGYQSYNYNNDALDAGGSYSDEYNYLTNSKVDTNGYKGWANDRLWIPSLTETGSSGETGMWMISVNQRVTEKSFTWSRSAHHSSYNSVFVIANTGMRQTYDLVYSPNAVRPAFHLNLKAAAARAGSLGQEEPTDVSVEYTGQSLTIADVSSEQKAWYSADEIDLEYPSGSMIDAGTYTVTAKIKDDLAADGLTFDGEPGDGETTTTRKFTFTITKKKIGVNVALDTGGKPVVSLKSLSDVFSGDTAGNGRAPNLGFNYTSSNGYNSETMPTAVGTYTATTKILNSGCNYVLDDTYSIGFTINKLDVPKPTISGQSSKQYTGEDITFTMTGGDNSNINITLPEGMTRNVNTLTAKKAGKYKVVVTLADNGVATQWPDGSISAIELEYEITKKPLGITISCDAPDFTWNVGDRPTVTIVGDSYPADSTELYIYYIDNKIGDSIKYDNINNDKVIEGKTRTIKMPGDIAQGSYTICVELYSDRKDNANYSLAVKKTAVFTVKGNSITVDDSVINWKYNNTEVGNPSDTLVLVYSGNEYRFSVDESVLAAHGAKIDIAKGTNGYEGNVSETNASSSLYSVTVHLTNLDSNYESYNAQYTLYYRIDKAKYDLSGLSWPSVNTLEYNGKAQGMTLQGTLPQGLTVSYSGNDKVPVGSYTTTVTFSVGSNYVNNYFVPNAASSDTYEGSLDFTFAWSITKATLSVSWKDDNVGESEVYKLPTLKSIGDLDVNSMVDYTYYDSKGNVVTSLPSQVTEEMTFKAVATLKTAFAGNYQFADGTNEYAFVIGKDKYAVTLILKWDGKNIDNAHLPYTGSPYTPTIEITKADGGIVPANITLKYYKDGSTSYTTEPPTEVGTYRIEATLNYGGDLNYIDSDSAQFEFEIVKADFDVSGLRWEYTHGEVTATYDVAQGKWLDGSGNEILPMTYDKTAHTLTLVGKDGINGLSITVSGNEQTNAGDNYTAQITFVYDSDNYNAPDFPTTLAWRIAKAKIDTTGIVWGYTKGVSTEEIAYTEALPYTRVEGGEVQYNVGLINVPDILKEFIIYTGTGKGAKSEIGSYVSEYTVVGLDGDNYEALVMPSGLPNKLNWSITPKVIAKPVFDGSWSAFDGEVHDFLQMFGVMEENWQLYIRINITKDGEPYTGISGEDYSHLTDKEYKAIKAGEYRIKFELILNNENHPNVNWTEWPDYEYIIKVKAYEIEVGEWQGSNTNAEVPVEEWIKPFIEYRYTDSDGNPVTLGSMQPGVVYNKEIYAKEGYEDDILIYGNTKMPVVRPGSGPISVEKPIFDEEKVITYDGNAHSVEEFLKKPAENGVKFEVDGDLINAGEYTITISIDGDTFKWEDGTTDSYTYTIKIAKKNIPQSALSWTTSDGRPTLSANGFGELEFTYEYFDADGNLLTAEQIASGAAYAKVVAKLVDNNYAMVDADNNVIEEVVYDPTASGNDPNDSENKGAVDFGKVGDVLKEWWQVIVSVICLILLIIFVAKGLGYASKRKQAKKTVEKKYKIFYAGATGLFGLAMNTWTAIACTMIGLSVLGLVFMIIEKSMCKKALNELDDAKEEYEQAQAKKKEEEMRMMFMGLMGGNIGGNMGAQGAPGPDMGEIRCMIEDAMARNALQQLPEQASANNELVQKLMDENAKNQESIQTLMQKLAEQSTEREAAAANANDEMMQKLLDQVQKLSEHSDERSSERAVATANLNDEILKELKEIKKQSKQPTANDENILKVVSKTEENDEMIKQLLKNQELLIKQIQALTENQQSERVVEKVVEKPVEKIVEKEVRVEVPVEKIVEVPVEVEKIVEKEVPVEVEKIVEKEVVKEVPIEVEKVVEKIVEIPAAKPAPKAKTAAPRLTLDEAYEKLSAKQKKIFDTLKAYAMSKDKCKEKKSTYYILLGQSSVNPLVKLTIKKDTTVALFKMEDEFMKDIRRNATNDGTKVKVKETELIVGDMQALATAKEMVDLREDQIERYNEFLKEQRSMKK